MAIDGNRPAPTASEVSDLLTGAEIKLRRIWDEGVQLRTDEGALVDLKTRTGYANGKVNTDTWAALQPDQQVAVKSALEQLDDKLQGIGAGYLKSGTGWFFAFFMLLAAVAGTYVLAHASPNASPLNAGRIVLLAEHVRNIETNGRTFVEKKKAQADENDVSKKADLIAQAETARADVRTRIDALMRDAEGINLSVASLQLIATVRSDADTSSLTDDVLTRLTKGVTADLESLRSGFLWNDDRGRWIEYAWWAELGALTSILFYIARQRKDNTFAPRDVQSFWTEALMAPVVVVAIFFLFAFIGINGISTTDTPIPGLVGFAFMFGYAVRRTLRLVDNLKNRFLPGD